MEIPEISEFERGVVRRFYERIPVSRGLDPAQDPTTMGQRVADRVARFGGSWVFIGLFFLVLAIWMLYNQEAHRPFDPFPFILLNLVLSCLAAVQAPLILMSQNRQSEKDRQRAQADYAVNLKAEMEILALHEKLDELRERSWQRLVEQQERQLKLLEQLVSAQR
jgi:uncharacterized membrane protein